MCICIYTHAHAYKYVYIYISTYTHVHVYIMYIYIYVYVYMCMCVIHVYIYMPLHVLQCAYAYSTQKLKPCHQVSIITVSKQYSKTALAKSAGIWPLIWCLAPSCRMCAPTRGPTLREQVAFSREHISEDVNLVSTGSW